MNRAIFFTLIFAIVAVPIVSATTIKVEAPESVKENETFTVNITVDNITNLNTALFDLSFNSSVLKAENVEDGQISGEVVPVDMWDFISDNTIRVLVMLPGDKGVSGSGYLAKVVFKAIRIGSSVLDLENGQLSDNKAEEIKAEWIDAIINVTALTTPATTTPTSTVTPTTNTTEANTTATPTVTTTATAVTTTTMTTTTSQETTTTTTTPTTTTTTTTPITTTTTIPTTTTVTTTPTTTTPTATSPITITTTVIITTTTATITTTKTPATITTTVPTATQTTTTAQPVSKKETPCFEAVFALPILILVVLLRRGS